MISNYRLFAAFLFFSVFSSAQRQCGTGVPPEEYTQWFNARVEEYKFNHSAMRMSQVNVKIPVIVHIVHGGQPVGTYPNISQTQVASQISVLNADYAGAGYNVSQVPSAFSGLVANTGISFCLAMLDPQGNALPEPGIDRVNYVTHGWTNPTNHTTQNAFMTYMDGTVKPATIWDPTRYLNIWVTDVNQAASMGILGYATFPPGSGLSGLGGSLGTAGTDGVWVYSDAFGSTGHVSYPYNRGRTATHEIGHYLGLRHVWGDGTNCTNNSDYCNDTPPQSALHYGCPSYPQVSCSNSAQGGDMFMNFMDYSDDACLYMFTPDQNARMQTALQNSTYRRDLSASSATLCNLQAQTPVASIAVNAEACIDTVFATVNNSSGLPAPNYSWSATPANNVTFFPSSTSSNPTIYFGSAGTYTIDMTAVNSAGYASDAAQVVVADCSPWAGLANAGSVLQMVAFSPNPSDGHIELRVSIEGRKDLNLEVVNLLGQPVYEESRAGAVSGHYPVNLSMLADGVYTVRISAGGERVTRRLVLNH